VEQVAACTDVIAACSSTLRRLHLSCKLTSNDAPKLLAALAGAVDKFEALRELRIFSVCVRSAENMTLLGRVLSKCPQLELLQLQSCLETPHVARLMHELLGSATRLRVLLLDDNSLEDSSINSMVPLLLESRRIRVLDLSMNSLTHSAGSALGGLLAANKALIVGLDISMNELDDAGKAQADVWRRARSLSHSLIGCA